MIEICTSLLYDRKNTKKRRFVMRHLMNPLDFSTEEIEHVTERNSI